MNNKIGKDPVKRRTVSLEDSDWRELSNLVISLKLKNGVSSLIRAFLRLHSSHKDTILPLLLKVIEENDRIQPESTPRTIKKGKFDLKDIVIGIKDKKNGI